VIGRSSVFFGVPDGKSDRNVASVPESAVTVDEAGPAGDAQNVAPTASSTASNGSFAESRTNSDDAAQALRNAGSLGSSVLVTAFLGLLIQFVYQHLLGTTAAGRVGGAESLSILLLGLLTFGVDTYARKEVALDPNSAKSFVSGIVAFRGVCAALVIASTAGVLFWIGRPSAAVWLFVLFGVTRFLLQTNELLLACLQAVGEVKGVAQINIAAKIFWAVFILGGIQTGLGALSVPAGWVLAELARAVMLGLRTHRFLGVLAPPAAATTARVLRASIPFTAGTIISNWSTYFDVTLISFWFNEQEVGLYRYAQTIAGVAFLVGTVLPWVLMPLASRAKERSEADYLAVMRRGIQLVFTIAIPVSVLLSLNADTIVSLLPDEWNGSVPALRILSFTVIATYIIMTTMTFLVVDGKAWLTVRLGLFGVVVNVILNLSFLRMGREKFGIGGAGTTAALIAVFAECLVGGLCLWFLGRRAWDRQSEWAIARVVLCGIVVVVIDWILARKGFSWSRLVTDAVVYVGLLFASGAVRTRDLKDILMKRATT
jgi:O-antigen/teichoic acid export membrane protein